MPEETVGAADLALCECEACKRKAGRPSRVRPGTIHSYSSQPRGGWAPRRVGDEDATAPTFGIELETDVPECAYRDLGGRPEPPRYLPWGATPEARAEHDAAERAWLAWDARNREHHRRQRERWLREGNMTADEAVSVAEPRGFWHPKHDGSVTGPEFASQPGTLAYWRAQRPHLASMFRSLLHGGMRSHDGDRCGLHVNVGRDAFADAEHLARFMALVAHNPRWSTRMAQRTHASQRMWARYDEIADADRRQRLAERFMARGYADTSHTSCVNLSNDGRVEFRLPRGTLRLDRFYAKLEWVAAMIEYARDAANATNPSAFMAWVQASGEYPALVEHMRDRFAARFGEGA